MVLLPVTDEQAAWLVQQLPSERKMNILLYLFQQTDDASTKETYTKQRQVDQWFEQRGADVADVSDPERVGLFMAMELIREIDRLTDPDVILGEQLRELKETQIRNRELAVQAITQKNYLAAQVDMEREHERKLDDEISRARAEGDETLAALRIRQKEERSRLIDRLAGALAKAEQRADSAKETIRAEEERFRLTTSEALALGMKLKGEQLTESIYAAAGSIEKQSWNAYLDKVVDRLNELEARGREIQAWLERMTRPDSNALENP